MLDITTIILTYNEELHIRRCLENVCPFSKKVYVVDSPSTDRTVEICQEFPKVEVVPHRYPGNQAEQFNWALDNLQIHTQWVLRLDADEYLTEELIAEMENKLPSLSSTISAVVFPLGRAFMGRILKHGIVNGIKMIRLFRYGKVRYELRLMDEHLRVIEGETVVFENKFIDDNRSSLIHFIDKHNDYSSREAVLLLDAQYRISNHMDKESKAEYAQDVLVKRAQKVRYGKLPLFFRSIGYFCYRYFVKLGFLDGKEGFCWDFFQGLWYRLLVDAKVYEAKKCCGVLNKKGKLDDLDKNSLRDYIKHNWNIQI